MKLLFYISMLGILCLAACRSTKKISHTEVKATDVSRTKDTSGRERERETNKLQVFKDSTHKVEKREAGKDLKADDLKPVYQQDGTPVAREHRFDGKGIHGTVKIDTAGNVKVDCVCDELEFTVRQMERTIIDAKSSETYWREQYQAQLKTQSIKTESKTVIERKSWLDWITAKAALVLLLWYVLKALFNIGKSIVNRYNIFRR